MGVLKVHRSEEVIIEQKLDVKYIRTQVIGNTIAKEGVLGRGSNNHKPNNRDR